MTIEAKRVFYQWNDEYLTLPEELKEKAIQHISNELEQSLKYVEFFRDGITPQIEAGKVFLRIYKKFFL